MNDSNYESADKMVSHPSHYQSRNGLEVIDIIESFTDGLNGIEAVDTANVIKYICRWKHKNGIQDIEKAIWYATHLLNHLKGIDERDVAEKIDDRTIEANAKDHMDKIIDILNKKDDSEDTPIGEAYELIDSKMNCIKVLDSLFYHGENSLTLIFAFYDDAKLFMTLLDDYFDKTNEAYYISADAILRMVGFDAENTKSMDSAYHTIGWFNMNDISHYDNVVKLSNPQSLFRTVRNTISDSNKEE
jgi:hypothetical protein